jgi:hypothetical protein
MQKANCGEIVGQLHGAIVYEQVHFQQRLFTVYVKAFLSFMEDLENAVRR